MAFIPDPQTFSLAGLAALFLFAVAVLAYRGWRDWLALERDRLAHHAPARAMTAEEAPAQSDVADPSRIEVAALRERVRRLEAIAAGVDL